MVRGHTRVVVIGCGVTGAGIARDLSLRGIECVVLDSRRWAAGASGANHGLLHSGARYAVKDFRAAAECESESRILKRIAHHCIEDTGGLFVGLPGDDESYFEDFECFCSKSNIGFQRIDPKEAVEIEPYLSKDIIAAYAVPDATVDPFRLTFENVEDARQQGSFYMPYSRVIGFDIKDGTIKAVRFADKDLKEHILTADFFINASGAWAGNVAALAGIFFPVLCCKGTLMVTATRITEMVVNRLRKPSDGDILVPGGTVSIAGTTSSMIADPDMAFPQPSETGLIIKELSAMIPELEFTRYIRAYSGVRPLFDIGNAGVTASGDREISRGFVLRDHSSDGVENFATISGGKLTTYRLMAEKTSDLVCRKLGVSGKCTTAEKMLPDSRNTSWSIPARSAKYHFMESSPKRLLCECEMISENIIDEVVRDLENEGREVTFEEIGLRTRAGKGSCQGCGCSARISAYLHEKGIYTGNDGTRQMKAMTESRWKGFRAVAGPGSAAQIELQEAVQLGIFGLERQ